MSIRFTCEHCNATHLVNDRFAGKRVRCPKCELAVQVPVLTEVGSEESQEASGDSQQDLPLGDSSEKQEEPSPQMKSATESDLTDGASRTQQSLEEDDEDDEPVLARQRRPEEEMDMTPMVDVTFLLLIFFMVTAAFSLQKSIEMPRQQTDAPSTSVQEEEVEELEMVELQVDEFGSFLVMAPEWERETPGKQNLISALKEAIAGSSDGMRLVVKVHELAKLKSLVDAMDAGTIAGYAQLEVTQVEEFD